MSRRSQFGQSDGFLGYAWGGAPAGLSSQGDGIPDPPPGSTPYFPPASTEFVPPPQGFVPPPAAPQAGPPGHPSRVPIGPPGTIATGVLQINPYALQAQRWVNFDAQFPVILWPLTHPLTGVIYYAPKSVPAEGISRCQRSRGAGIVYLPHAGRWRLRYDGATATDVGEFVVIDARDPAVALRYLADPGTHFTSTVALTAAGPFLLSSIPIAGAASVLLLNANRNRKGVLIRNVGLGQSLRFKYGVAVGTVFNGDYDLAPNNNTVELFGDFLHHANIVATWDTGAVPAAGSLIVQEWT